MGCRRQGTSNASSNRLWKTRGGWQSTNSTRCKCPALASTRYVSMAKLLSGSCSMARCLLLERLIGICTALLQAPALLPLSLPAVICTAGTADSALLYTELDCRLQTGCRSAALPGPRKNGKEGASSMGLGASSRVQGVMLDMLMPAAAEMTKLLRLLDCGAPAGDSAAT